MWILLSFGSAFFAGLTSILAKCGIKNMDSNLATALRTIVVLLFSCIMVVLADAQHGLSQLDGQTLLFLFLSGLATGASWLCYFRALQLGDVNKVTPIDKSSTIMTMVLAILLFREDVTVIKCIAMVLIALGTYYMIEKKESSQQTPSGKSYLGYAFASAIFASLTSILGKIGVSHIDSTLGTAIRTTVVLVMAWVVVFVTKKEDTFRKIGKKNALFLCLSGISTGASWLCYYKALQLGDASIVVPIDKLSILITVTFSYVVFQEKLTRKAFTGLILIVIGTLLLLV